MLYSVAGMARTLFFVEAFALALLAVIFPLIGSEASAAAFVLPLAVSLALPLACALAVWPAGAVLEALRAAFGTAGSRDAPRSARILGSLAANSRVASALGVLLSLASAFSDEGGRWDGGARAILGAYLAAYALLNFQLWSALAAVAVLRPRLPSPPAPVAADGSEGRRPLPGSAARALAPLTPREREAALLIGGGMSYKEAASELGISIKTMKAHMGKVYEKTGAPSNVALALLLRVRDGDLDQSPMAQPAREEDISGRGAAEPKGLSRRRFL